VDVLGGDFDGGAEEVLELYDEAAFLAAAFAEKASLESVEGTAEDADVVAVEGLGDLVGGVVDEVLVAVDDAHELLHLFGAYGHGMEAGVAASEPVLEGGDEVDDGVEDGAGGVDEEEVGEEGAFFVEDVAIFPHGFLVHGGVDLDLPLGDAGEEFIGAFFGVGSLEIAEDVPLDGVGLGHGGGSL
jgi:hypothetical protein